MDRQKKDLLDTPFLHPFLIAIYLVLSLWLANIDQVPLFAIARPMAFSLAAAAVSLAAGLLIFRRAGKAAAFASLALLLFLSYGRIFDAVDMKEAAGLLVGRHRFLLPLWAALFATGTFLIARARGSLTGLNRAINLVSLFLAALVLGQGIFFWASAGRASSLAEVVQAAAPEGSAASQTPQARTRPDVYYILLDAYSRQDVLKEKHGVDDSQFIRELRELGFTVLDCAQSNYAWTPLSMAASLNMDYLEGLNIHTPSGADRVNSWDFQPLFQRSRVLQTFKALGYQTVTFRPVYPWMDIPGSDHYFDLEKSASFYDRQETVNFQYLFLRTTAMRLLLEVQEKSPETFESLPAPLLRLINPKAGLLSSRHFKQYDQNRYALEQLENLPSMPGPKFVYAHLFITHQPYTFNLDGSMRWPPVENMEAYNIQVQYAGRRMAEILQSILKNSPVPPVIILQSDHSYFYDQSRVKILNAYYLPGGGAKALYPAITPVNSFRLVFNMYFGKNYPLLEDMSYFSERKSPYNFETVPNVCLQDTNR